MHQENLNHFHRIMTERNQAITVIDKEIRSTLKDEKAAQVEYAKKSWLLKLIHYIPYELNMHSIQSSLKKLQSETTSLKKDIVDKTHMAICAIARDDFMNSPDAEKFAYMESDLIDIRNLVVEAKAMKQLAQSTLQYIDDALSNIDDAQFAESIDMMTDNKAVSVFSTLSNSDASSSIDEAKQSIKRLNAALIKHQDKVADIEEHIHIEYIDLALDLTLGGIGDMIGSIVSLEALDNAEDSVRNAHVSVLEIVDAFTKQLELYEKEESLVSETLIENKRSYRVKAINIMNKNGCHISTSTVNEITITNVNPNWYK